jgi:hypothetical protein
MNKELITPDKIIVEINCAMKNSAALDGDCRNCKARRIYQTSVEEQAILDRNWNIDLTSGECQGECMLVLEKTANEIGSKYDVSW